MQIPSAKVHISPLYLLGHVRDGGSNYKTQVIAFIVHVPVTPDKIWGSGTFFSSLILLPCNCFWTFHVLFEPLHCLFKLSPPIVVYPALTPQTRNCSVIVFCLMTQSCFYIAQPYPCYP